jgi:hypothetical protein
MPPKPSFVALICKIYDVKKNPRFLKNPQCPQPDKSKDLLQQILLRRLNGIMQCNAILHYIVSKTCNIGFICFEPRKRLISIGNKEIHIWPIQEFLEMLWGNNMWV